MHILGECDRRRSGTQTNTTSLITSDNGEVGPPASSTLTVVPIGPVPPDVFQVIYASNLQAGDSVFNITNTGAYGNLCVNVYAFSPDEQLISCCSCLVTPNGLMSLSARNDLLPNVLTPSIPTSIVVKMVGSAGGSSPTTCNAATAGSPTSALEPGLAAWGTTLHALPGNPVTYGTTENRFTDATLSAAELARITGLCGFIESNGSGFGICRACRVQGLGAVSR